MANICVMFADRAENDDWMFWTKARSVANCARLRVDGLDVVEESSDAVVVMSVCWEVELLLLLELDCVVDGEVVDGMVVVLNGSDALEKMSFGFMLDIKHFCW